jgi:hypothetical protein
MPESIPKTMKLSTFTLGALLASASGTQAQTAYKDSLQTDTVKNSKTPAAQITEKNHQIQIQEKTNTPTTKGHKPRYCPTCGRG